MSTYQHIIIGGGLSGLAAGIRLARFGRQVLILEQHDRPGGLNSYYRRHGFLLETGLHAMTNFATAKDRRAPLNRLFRQLKLSRQRFKLHEQQGSEIIFPEHRLCFSNDLEQLRDEINREFPQSLPQFDRLCTLVRTFDPFQLTPWRSCRQVLRETLNNPQLEEMLLLPLMVYGNSEENDMDLSQFVIMFQAVFLEGFFRPDGTIKDFLTLLLDHYKGFGGEIRYRSKICQLEGDSQRIKTVVLENGERLTADTVLSTAGIPATAQLSGWPLPIEKYCGRMTFMENITLCKKNKNRAGNPFSDRSILFYNHHDTLHYHCPHEPLDPSWGVICFPENFIGLPAADHYQIRVTNSAAYPAWKNVNEPQYQALKATWQQRAYQETQKIIGDYQDGALFSDSFTPRTIEKYTAKAGGAVYGSPIKIKDGRTPWDNLFIAGTDQGFLGIVGAMLSGVSIVNQHLLTD